MLRNALIYLEENWINIKDRKPLILRGARQVGKTWLARAIAEKTQRKLIEINFEKTPDLKTFFDGNDPKVIIKNLEIYFGSKILPQSSLLFLDEIQDAPEVLTKLRWFYEEMPELPVITAGSLLEFILADHAFSMPVGRITYLHLEPLSFEEFLHALGKESLLDYINEIIPPFDIKEPIHHALRQIFRTYLYVGGMPKAVSVFLETESMDDVMRIQQDLLSTYRDDFSKYKGKIDIAKLDTLIKAIPFQMGKKFMYSKADSSIQSATSKQILSLFNMAKLCHVVKSTHGNGVPLGAEINEKAFKQIFMDVGLTNRLLGNSFSISKSTIEGGLSEQVVGQTLRTLYPFYEEPKLYYWHREEKGSNAEIDYLIEHKHHAIPIEIKSGSTGSLKSLHLFMGLKNKKIAVRINDDLPSITPVSIKNANKSETKYTLLSIPFYLTSQIHRFLDSLMKNIS